MCARLGREITTEEVRLLNKTSGRGTANGDAGLAVRIGGLHGTCLGTPFTGKTSRIERSLSAPSTDTVNNATGATKKAPKTTAAWGRHFLRRARQARRRWRWRRPRYNASLIVRLCNCTHRGRIGSDCHRSMRWTRPMYHPLATAARVAGAIQSGGKLFWVLLLRTSSHTFRQWMLAM